MIRSLKIMEKVGTVAKVNRYKFIEPYTAEVCVRYGASPTVGPTGTAWMENISSTAPQRKCVETKRMVFEVGDIITGTTYFAEGVNEIIDIGNVTININGFRAAIPLSKLVKISPKQNGKIQSSFLVWVIIAIIAFLIFTNNQKTQN